MIVKILKKKKFILVIFLLILLINFSNAIENVVIIKKINNKIITNVDLNNEYNYLIALNENLKNLNDKEARKISEQSLIREIIKHDEIVKYLSLEDFQNEELVNNVIKNIYLNLNLVSIEDFESYLKKFGVSINDVIRKISIEIAWNQLIVSKFNNQININEDKILEKIKNDKLNSKEIIEYNLSEIVFQANNQSELENKTSEIEEFIKESGFSTAANKFSISDTAKLGGLIGKINDNQLSLKFQNELKKLNTGKFSKPINVGNRFIILFINEKKIINEKLDEKEILKSMIDFERKSQFENFSQIYFEKIKLNMQIQ